MHRKPKKVCTGHFKLLPILNAYYFSLDQQILPGLVHKSECAEISLPQRFNSAFGHSPSLLGNQLYKKTCAGIKWKGAHAQSIPSQGQNWYMADIVLKDHHMKLDNTSVYTNTAQCHCYTIPMLLEPSHIHLCNQYGRIYSYRQGVVAAAQQLNCSLPFLGVQPNPSEQQLRTEQIKQ